MSPRTLQLPSPATDLQIPECNIDKVLTMIEWEGKVIVIREVVYFHSTEAGPGGSSVPASSSWMVHIFPFWLDVTFYTLSLTKIP